MSENPSSERKIKVFIMNRGGDSRLELVPDAVVETAHKEMAEGKWLRLVASNGGSEIIRTVGDLDQRVTRAGGATKLFEDVNEVGLIAALVGGR